MCEKENNCMNYHFMHLFPTPYHNTYLHTYILIETPQQPSILFWRTLRIVATQFAIEFAKATQVLRSENDRADMLVRDAHLRSHFLRIMTRFLSRNKINPSGWAWRLSLEKMIAQWKRERMENECCSRSSFLFFFVRCVHHRTLSIAVIIPLLGSWLAKMIQRLRSNTNFLARISYSVYSRTAERYIIFWASTFAFL